MFSDKIIIENPQKFKRSENENRLHEASFWRPSSFGHTPMWQKTGFCTSPRAACLQPGPWIVLLGWMFSRRSMLGLVKLTWYLHQHSPEPSGTTPPPTHPRKRCREPEPEPKPRPDRNLQNLQKPFLHSSTKEFKHTFKSFQIDFSTARQPRKYEAKTTCRLLAADAKEVVVEEVRPLQKGAMPKRREVGRVSLKRPP